MVSKHDKEIYRGLFVCAICLATVYGFGQWVSISYGPVVEEHGSGDS